MAEWWRGRDNYQRVHTFSLDGDQLVHYFPDEGGQRFGYSRRPTARESFDMARIFETSVREARDTHPASEFDRICEEFGIVERVRSERKPGEYFTRIWRPGECPLPRDVVGELIAWKATVRYSRILYGHLRDVARYVEPHRDHDSVHGHQIRELLLLACMEVESAWRATLQHHYGMDDKDRLTTRNYFALCAPMRLNEWEVELSAHPTYGKLAPFAGWSRQEATRSLPWYDAYNETKHNREGALERATFRHVLDAVAAVFVLTVAQFGTSHLAENSDFHVDEFRIARRPDFALAEQYIRPLAKSDSEGAGEWTPIMCPLSA